MSKRRVLVTGASRGIGRAIAIALGRDGFDVCVHFRSGAAEARATLDTIEGAGGSGCLLGFDVGDPSAARECLDGEIAERGAFWGVVHNAGVTADGPLASMKQADWDRVLTTNLDGFFHVVQPCLMPMVRLRDEGRVIAISSVSGVLGNRGQTNYAASKAGLIAACRSLAKEVAKRKITVNAVAPGFVATDMVADLPKEVLDVVPLKRMGQPEEVADLVAFLFSDRAAYITGQTIGIDGGMS